MSENETTTNEPTADDVRGVFDLWIGLLRPGSRVKPRLDDKRSALIRRAIKGYDTETCMDAIRGCSVSDFHLGKNPRNKPYTDIELILRDSQHVEKFANIWHDHVESGAGDTEAAREGDSW